jgi:hypothetical protein
MNADKAKELIDKLDDKAVVVDVGGGGSPFPRADHVIDMTAYENRAALGKVDVDYQERFTVDAWTVLDICERKPWPFADNYFDFATCSHVLEDIRDPIWVCSELSRVAKAGYIEVPSRIIEQSRGVEHPLYAGFYHHRWLIDFEDNAVLFRHKSHSLHSLKNAIVADIGIRKKINPKYGFISFEWKNSFDAKEVLEFNEDKVNEELCHFAENARDISDLFVDTDFPLSKQISKFIYYWKLKYRI